VVEWRGGEDISKRHEQFKLLASTLAELTVHVGLMSSVANNWPENVQDNWTDKVDGMIERAEQDIREVQQFAEAFDED
jgi:hypothetical protein